MGIFLKKNSEPEIEIKTKDPEEIEAFQNLLRGLAERILLPHNEIENVDINDDKEIDGYTFNMSNPFYTSQPVSSVKSLEISLDGEKIEREKIKLIVRDQRISLMDAISMYELWWKFGEVIQVYVEKRKGLQPGNHMVECVLKMRTTMTYGFPGDLIFPTRKLMVLK
jgi:hypothetical protein